jgi:hypothetical protein
MKKYIIFILSIFILLTGCSKNQSNDEVPKLIEVTIQIPEAIKINEEVELEAIVTQGDDKVEDANKVEFEIGKTDQEGNEKIVAEHQGDGVYTVKKTFDQAGEYKIIAHVTARSMHSMPNKVFNVNP